MPRAVLITLCLLVLSFANGKVMFEGSEHRFAGNNLAYISMILGPDGSDVVFNANNQYQVFNFSANTLYFTNGAGVKLYTYGDIVAMGGDFYGAQTESSYICSASSAEEKDSLFKAVYRQLWNEADQSYIDKIKTELDLELKQVTESSEEPFKTFSSLGETRFGQFKNMINLLLYNFDHFGPCAIEAYKVGHTAAMTLARQASDSIRSSANFAALPVEQRKTMLTLARSELSRAYVMNAISDHFLSDLFAAGHVRTPRKILASVCSKASGFTGNFLSVASSGLAAQWMHDEDNRNGIIVKNLRGDVWKSLGDDNYWSKDNERNRQIISEALQISKNEVFQAFLGGLDSFTALNLIPDSSLLPELQEQNTCPLYMRDPSDQGTLLIRDPPTTIRPPIWNFKRGINGTIGNSTQCNYIQFTPSNCPSVVSSKIEKYVIPQEYTLGWNKVLYYSNSSQAWITNRSNYSAAVQLSYVNTFVLMISVCLWFLVIN